MYLCCLLCSVICLDAYCVTLYLICLVIISFFFFCLNELLQFLPSFLPVKFKNSHYQALPTNLVGYSFLFIIPMHAYYFYICYACILSPESPVNTQFPGFWILLCVHTNLHFLLCVHTNYIFYPIIMLTY